MIRRKIPALGSSPRRRNVDILEAKRHQAKTALCNEIPPELTLSNEGDEAAAAALKPIGSVIITYTAPSEGSCIICLLSRSIRSHSASLSQLRREN